MKAVSSAMNPHKQSRKSANSCNSDNLHRVFYDGYTADEDSVSLAAVADFHDLQRQLFEHLHFVNTLQNSTADIEVEDTVQRLEQFTELNAFLTGMGKSMNDMLGLMEARDRMTEKGSTKQLLDAVYELDETSTSGESRRIANKQRAARKRVT